jgi:hypothetical protein
MKGLPGGKGRPKGGTEKTAERVMRQQGKGNVKIDRV